MKLYACLLLMLSAVTLISAATNKVICYYGSWSHYRTGNGKVTVDDLNPRLCTHMIYSFVGINSNGGVAILDSWLDIDLQGLAKFVALKNSNPNLKQLVAIGGWNQGGAVFSQVVENPSLRATFVQNILNFVKQHKFDGFDLDWEYPNGNGGRPQDKQTFIQLLKELRPLFDANNLLLTAAVGATASHRDASYDVPNMNRYLDLINVMSYDLHGSWEPVTGQNAPLYASSADTNRDLNVATIMPQWINAGADPQKLVLGLGFYGRSFTLANANNNKIGAPTIGGGTAGPFTAEAGTLAYVEICTNAKNGWTEVWDNEQQVPYAYKGNQWIGYDNIQSLEKKIDYAKSLNLAGVMVWSVEQDDIRNLCGGGDWPLLRAVNNRIGTGSGSAPPPPPPPTSAPGNPATTTTRKPSVGGKPDCSTDGFSADPADCQSFYVCSSGTLNHFKCGAGTLYDKNLQTCNHAAEVQC